MKSHKLTFLSLLMLGSVSLSGCYVDLGFIHFGEPDGETNTADGKLIYDEKAQLAHIDEYYETIDTSLSGQALLNDLKALNVSSRRTLVTYSAMGTSSNGKFKFTDYDPSTVKFNSDGIPYGTKILSFYSGKSTNTFNREHVWPNSRNGNAIEDDIFMPRPTVAEENSDRGNSIYKTGMATEYDGWDPVTAFGNTIGNYEGIRGECARIIFYCMTAASGLVLNEVTANNRNNMGSLTNLVEWSCDNPVNMREKRRQVGGEYLQGNRNAFVDHPEYVCKIWGGTNDATKAACQRANYAIN